MRVFLLMLLLNLSYSSISAQEKRSSFVENLDDVEVVFKNGDHILGSVENLAIKWRRNDIKPWSIEKRMGLHKKTFVLVQSNGEEKIIKSDSVKSIFIYDDKGFREVRRLNLKTVNVKGEIVNLDKNVWLPVTVSGHSVSILSFNKYESYPTIFKKKKNQSIDEATYAGTYVYLQREEEDFAIIPIDLNRLNPFNTGSIGDKYKIALKETFRDCDKTLALIDKDWDVPSNKEGLKRFRALQKEEARNIKKLPKEERKYAWDKFYTDYTLSFYLPILEQYHRDCP